MRITENCLKCHFCNKEERAGSDGSFTRFFCTQDGNERNIFFESRENESDDQWMSSQKIPDWCGLNNQ